MCPGFLPGTEQEFGGIIRHGAKLLYAYAEATVPEDHRDHAQGLRRRVLRDGVEAHPHGHEPRLAHRGDRGDGAGGRGEHRVPPRARARRATRTRVRQQKIEEFRERFANPFVAAERGYVDDVIEPRETRPRVIRALRMLENKVDTMPRKKHGNIPL